MEIKNLKKTADRIKKAIKNKEKIILYGDADLDGISSLIILADSIKNLGGDISSVYFPLREKEGYGITKTALDSLKEFSPALFLTLDCGISNFKETSLAEKMGFEVVIIEHHEVLDRLPEAAIIVDPKQKGDKYPFKGLATAGIVYRLARILLKDKFSDSLKKNFLELVALATIADMMPVESENKEMIEQGLSVLRDTWRPGLRAFFEIDEIKDAETIREISQKIIFALNLVEQRDRYPETYLLLTAGSLKEAKMKAEYLLAKREGRQQQVREIVEEMESRLAKKMKEPIVFEGNSVWLISLLGAAASRICRQHQKPTFLFKKQEKESRGAVRTPSGINAVEMMKKCSKYLLSFGGHAQAAGFVAKSENLEKFKECLIKSYNPNDAN
jgi:single-stranded-DNA-specific exonuclease